MPENSLNEARLKGEEKLRIKWFKTHLFSSPVFSPLSSLSLVMANSSFLEDGACADERYSFSLARVRNAFFLARRSVTPWRIIDRKLMSLHNCVPQILCKIKLRNIDIDHMSKLTYLYWKVSIDWTGHLNVHQFSHYIDTLGHWPRRLESRLKRIGAWHITHKSLGSGCVPGAREEQVLTTNTERLENQENNMSIKKGRKARIKDNTLRPRKRKRWTIVVR